MGWVLIFDIQGWITLFIGSLLALITFFSSYSHVSIPFGGTAQIRDHKVYYDDLWLPEILNDTPWQLQRYNTFQLGMNSFFCLEKNDSTLFINAARRNLDLFCCLSGTPALGYFFPIRARSRSTLRTL